MPVSSNRAEDFLSLAQTLSRSELRCLSLTASGHDVDSVARKMSLARREIELLLYCAERKLKAENRLHAVSIALLLGLVDEDD